MDRRRPSKEWTQDDDTQLFAQNVATVAIARLKELLSLARESSDPRVVRVAAEFNTCNDILSTLTGKRNRRDIYLEAFSQLEKNFRPEQGENDQDIPGHGRKFRPTER
jgi:hypothetical protein